MIVQFRASSFLVLPRLKRFYLSTFNNPVVVSVVYGKGGGGTGRAEKDDTWAIREKAADQSS